MKKLLAVTAILIGAGTLSCARNPSPSGATVEEAKAFLASVNGSMEKLGIEASQAGWVQQNFITIDTEALGARANQRYIDAIAKAVKETTRFDTLDLPADERRQLNVLKTSLVMATPSDAKEAEELTTIMARLNGTYGKGKWCPEPANAATCLNIDDITNVMAESRDPKRLREVWEGWHTISPPMRKDYARFVELSNKGARELGFADTGAMWRAKYDMAPDAFTTELDRLWDQVRPLYLKLHAYVRMKLHEKYGDLVPANGPIPAHLLGNIWAQEWGNVYSVFSAASADPG
jgi:peptidyl-dipeptidase A